MLDEQLSGKATFLVLRRGSMLIPPFTIKKARASFVPIRAAVLSLSSMYSSMSEHNANKCRCHLFGFVLFFGFPSQDRPPPKRTTK
jgi:hypothetical protein